MRTVTYHLHSAQTGTLPGAASATIIRKGKIVGARLGSSLGGGAAGGYYSITLENQTGQANGDTNNPPREVVLAALNPAVGSGSVTSTQVFVPLEVPVEPGDILSLNIVQTGTAAGTARHQIDVFVME